MSTENYEARLQEMENKHRFTLSQISHEIRNPVTLISSFLQLMKSQHPEITQFEHWDQVMSNMDFLRSLLEEISSYNASGSINPTTANLYYLMKDLVEDVSPTLFKRNIQLHLEKKTAIPPYDVDSVKFRQILHNLIRNSAEAIGQNGSITLGLSCDVDSVIITLADDGPGIPKEYIDTLFDPFVTHKKDGTGLGLTIVKNIITAHNGTVNVRSEEGAGTLFTLVFPL